MYGHANRVSRLYCLLLVISLINVGWFHPQNDVKDFRHSALDAITQAARRDEFSPSLGCSTLTNNRRHLGLDKLTVNGYSNARVSRYPNAVSTFQLTRLTTSGDVCPNPGPPTTKPSCQMCSRTIARNHRALHCNLCGLNYHMKCGQVTTREYKSIQLRDPKTWICNSCLLKQPQSACGFDESDLLTALPFGSLSDDSFSSVIGSHTPPFSDVLPKDDECESPFTDLVHRLSKCSAKDLKVAHLNICSLRNKIDELRCLQLLCKFEVLAITETHLDETVLDTALNIDGMKLLRLDRKGRKGGGCALYFAEYLHAIYRKGSFIEGLEAIWLQVKTSSTLALFSVIYRPPDDNLFFERINMPLEKAWLRSENIFLLGDFNCDFSFQGDPDNILHRNAIKLRSIFETFNMHNMIQEATRSTISSRSLLDLFVTTTKDLISSSGVFPLGLSDHDLIYATIRLKNKRPPPKFIKTRNYKRMDVETFKHDLECTLFHIASIFEEPDDQLWVWERLFDDISNEHAPWREIKVRSFSSPWITCEIRHKMNRRYKLFNAAISSKCPEQWSNYKRVRNEVTSDLRKAKSSYFSTIFNEVKSSSAYWNLLKRATNPKVRKNIGPLKKDGGTLELTDSGKANLMNSYFTTIGLKLSNTLPPPTSCGHGITCADKGEKDTSRLTDAYVSKSLVADKI